jgi:hypothetical protein
LFILINWLDQTIYFNFVASLVDVLVALGYKPLWAIVALIILLTGMDFLVVTQAIFELKSLATDLVGALIWLRIA